MAYLSEKATVYCNALLTKHASDMILNHESSQSDEDTIPPHWIRLRVENGSAVEEHRWWREYNSLM